MIFNEKSHKVILDTLNKEEAKPYKLFLRFECVRHLIDIFVVFIIGIPLFLPAALGNNFALNSLSFWESAITRHQEDIEGINKLIKRINKRFGWE